MIHVCQIDNGTRYIFDMAHGIDDVATLKQAIENEANIIINNQILLINGGEVLKNNKQKLFGLSAGIEESPIYLIDLKNVKLNATKQQQLLQQQLQQQLNSFIDMSKDIDDAIHYEPSYQTLLQRTQLAFKVYDNDFLLNKLCEQYYHDQYRQYQGFMALIANLDELVISFEKSFEKTKEQFKCFNQNKINNLSHLNELETHINLLSNINLIPELADHAAKQLTLFQSVCSQSNINYSQSTANLQNIGLPQFTSSSTSVLNEQQQQQLVSPISSPSSTTISSYNLTSPNSTIDTTTISLLDWTNSTDPRHKLESVLLKAKESFDCLDENWWNKIENEYEIIIKEAKLKQYREIDGFTRRLSDLNSLLDLCKTYLNRQRETGEGFKTNLNRATSLNDELIIHDLCIGHETSLSILSQNHVQILDITKRICKAKYELTKVVSSRLNWVMNIQTQLVSNLHTKLVICNEKVKQSSLYMKQIEQIKNAPNIYFQALNETIRREKFSNLYKEFANEIHSIISDLTKAEIKRREQFAQKFSRNYIANLFPYLNDSIQTFIKTDLNLNFDLNLPKLNKTNINSIENDFKQKHKEYELEKFDFNDKNDLKFLDLLNNKLKNEIKIFRKKLSEEPIVVENIVETVEQQVVDSVSTNDDDDDDDDDNSQTDTSALFISKLTDTQIANSDNDEQLILVNKKPSANKEFIEKLNEIYKREINDLKSNIEILRDYFDQLQKQIKNEYKIFENLISNLKFEMLNEKLKKKQFYKNLIENLFSKKTCTDATNDTTTNKLENTTSIGFGTNGDDDIDGDKLDEEFSENLKENLIKLRETYDKAGEEIRKSMDILKTNYLAEKQKTFNDAIDRVCKIKDKQIEELESLQTRLTSELALIKVQNTNEYRLYKEKDLEIDELKVKQLELANELTQIKIQYENELHFSKKKDKEIDELKEKLLGLTSELTQFKEHKTTELSDKEDALKRSLLKQQRLVEHVHQLEQQLIKLMNTPINSRPITSSNAVTQQPQSALSVQSSSIPISIPKLSNTQFHNVIQLNSCTVGDLVLVLYDFTHCSYRIIYQDSPYTHFVHTDSIKIFDISSQIYKEFINSTEQQQQQQQLSSSPQKFTSLPSSPSSPLSFEDTFTGIHSSKEAIQSLIGDNIYNNGSNLLSSCTIPIRSNLETSTTTLTSIQVNTSTSLLSLNSNHLNKPLWFIGRVNQKEFCIAKKENNRYKVPSGTQFYRVRVQPFKI